MRSHQWLAVSTLDVTEFIKQGQRNAIGAISYTTADKRFQLYMKIFYTDGTSQTVTTGGNWKALDGTAIYGDDGTSNTAGFHIMNENIDARLFPYGWSEPGYNDSAWSQAAIRATIEGTIYAAQMEPMKEYSMPVEKLVNKGGGNYFIQLEKEIVGGLRLTIPQADGMSGSQITVRFGEELLSENTVRWQTAAYNTYSETWTLTDGNQEIAGWGIKCFRYVEILNWPSALALTADMVEGIAIRQGFNDDESAFESSSQILNDIWELCKYTIKASNQDLYVDSHTRERTVYEGDNYIQQLSSYAVSRNYNLARHSNMYVMYRSTWPVEYRYQIIMSAWEDYLYSGNMDVIRTYYPKLEEHLLLSCYDADKKLFWNEIEHGLRPIIDWPEENRDNYDMTVYYTTVVNCYASHALQIMADMAGLLNNSEKQQKYAGMAEDVRQSINHYFLADDGFYYEGMHQNGTLSQGKSAIAASIYPLLFGITESNEQNGKLGTYIADRGLRGNVYTAQFQLQALFASGLAQEGLDLLTNTSDKSWAHMIYDLDATMTTELFDPSQGFTFTYSHPWASSPANVIVRDMFGIVPLEPSFDKLQIKPQTGSLEYASLKTPTVKGSVCVNIQRPSPGMVFEMTTATPVNTEATVYVPAMGIEHTTVIMDGEFVQAVREGDFFVLDGIGSGEHLFQIPFAEDAAYILTIPSGEAVVTGWGHTTIGAISVNPMRDGVTATVTINAMCANDSNLIHQTNATNKIPYILATDQNGSNAFTSIICSTEEEADAVPLYLVINKADWTGAVRGAYRGNITFTVTRN